ncbi:hypothetical protein ACFZDG_26885 [Kitasatospora xanthocidica]|uniref:hypothetical protein n=1 Tax=Kitasatospora xanthocidica TaxID=83382 RepID=UPI0036E8F611
MTNMTLVAAESGAGDEDQEQRERQYAVNEVLAEAAEAGRRAAGWVRELAGRQPEERHRIVLERATDAVERAAGPEVVPGGEGQPDDELAYDLSASIITGNPYAEALPELPMGERIVLTTVCTLAAAMPASVLGELERELPALAALAATMDAAGTAGRAACPDPAALPPAP